MDNHVFYIGILNEIDRGGDFSGRGAVIAERLSVDAFIGRFRRLPMPAGPCATVPCIVPAFIASMASPPPLKPYPGATPRYNPPPPMSSTITGMFLALAAPAMLLSALGLQEEMISAVTLWPIRLMAPVTIWVSSLF